MKARATFKEAEVLFSLDLADGAANRAWYAIFHAISAKFTLHYGTPSKLLKKPVDNSRYSHQAVAEHCGKAGCSSSQSRIISTALRLRVQADYRPDPVILAELKDVMAAIPDILTRVGA